MRDKSKYTGSRWILIQDCILSLVASIFSILLVRWLSEPMPGFTFTVAKWLVGSLVGSLIGFLISGVWKMVRRYFTIRSSGNALLAILIKEIVLILFLVTGLVKLPSSAFGVLAVMTDLILTGFFLLYFRIASHMLSPSSDEEVRKKSVLKNVLIAGTTPGAVKLCDEVEEEGYYTVSGFVTDDPEIAGRVIADKPVYYCKDTSSIETLHYKVGGVDAILFPRDYKPSQKKNDQPLESKEVHHNDGMSLAGLALKRAFDTGLSGVLLLVFSPLLAICAAAIKIEDGGPVIFKQERIGRDGKPFTIYKLRSMRIDAESESGPSLYQGDDDDRLTKVGRFLRNHHLDELPQLYNVFKGDMSFIGHRPERKFYIDQIMSLDPRYRFLYQIRPGVTSYATLYNGYTDTIEKMLTRLDLDLYYLRNRSVWFDVKVLGLTFLSIISGKRF